MAQVIVTQYDNLIRSVQLPFKFTGAMARAKPTLSTHVGDIPKILGDTSYLVDPDSPEQLAQKRSGYISASIKRLMFR